MEKSFCLLLLAALVCALQTSDMQNATCSKKVRITKIINEDATCRTSTGWWFIRNTKYRKCQVKKTSYVTKTIFECCKEYINVTGMCEKAPCPFGTFGVNCSLNCSCVAGQFSSCDINGTCSCSPGWIGQNCSQACEQGWFGDGCKQSCPCKNNATCDHVTGTCDCTSVLGKTGEMCDKDCPPSFFGRNCSSDCNCSTFQSPVCDSFHGYCVCISGKMGDNCTQECSNNTFGPNCTKTCNCVPENTVGCNSSTGVCTCKKGWEGATCATGCELYRFGEGCEQNCSCKDTEVCDNENGACSQANVCLAKNTRNCLPSLNLTCQQVSENCNLSIPLQASLQRDMQDICCGDSVSSNDVICIAEGNCSCREKYAGSICDDSVLAESSVTKESQENMSGSSTGIVIGIVVALVIIIIGVVVIGIIVSRSKKSSAIIKKAIDNPGNGTQILEDSRPMSVAKSSLENQDYNTTQRHRGREQDQSEMYDLNRHDSNDYGYNVSTHSKHKEREDQSENYASTAFDEQYDHLQRSNNKKVQEADYSYSHQPFLMDNSEYNTAGMPVLQTDNDYYSTETVDSQETMYSNTRNIISDR